MTKRTLTLEALLEEKKATKPKKWIFESEELGAEIEIDKINPQKITSIISDISDGNADEYTIYLKLIYESVSLFRTRELIKKHEVVEPFEIVDVIFDRNLGEIYALGNQICANYGFGSGAKDSIKK